MLPSSPLLALAPALTVTAAGAAALGFASTVVVLELVFSVVFTLVSVLVRAATAALVVFAGAPAFLLLTAAATLTAAAALASGVGP